MIQLVQKKQKQRIVDADYVLDKADKFYDIVSFLTPKFEKRWVIALIDPKLVFIKELISDRSLPNWLDVYVYVGAKKLEEIVLERPDLQPKEVTRKETFDNIISGVNHLINEDARRVLYKALGNRPDELETLLKKLDDNCDSAITLKDVQKEINYTNVVYASDVLNAYLCKKYNRTTLYNKLLKSIGMEVAYYAMYKYAKSLLKDKEKYLRNEDVKNYMIKELDAPLICYVYTLFANSTDYHQLPAILYAIEYRSETMLSICT